KRSLNVSGAEPQMTRINLGNPCHVQLSRRSTMCTMSFVRDIRLALRLFRQTPSTTVIALISIALTVAATSVVYTAINAVLIDPLPYSKPEQLVQFRSDFPFLANSEQSQTDFVFWRDAREIMRRAHTFQSIGIYGNALFDLAGDASTLPEALYGL